MRIIFLLLLGTLLFSYYKALSRVIKNSNGLTPILGWLAGLAFFVLAPLTIMTVNGGYELPSFFGVGQSWRVVNLTNATSLIPFVVIWFCMMSVCLVIHIFYPSGMQERTVSHLLSRGRLVRAILITMGLSVVNWALLVWLAGGVAEFFVSHWYRRNEDLVAHFGDAYVLFDHLALANQIVFVSAAVLYTGLGVKNRDTKWAFTSLILLFFLLEMVITGNRMYFAIYLLGFFSSCWVYRRKRIIVGILAMSPVFVLVFSAWATLRHSLTEISDSVSSYIDADYGNRTVSSLIDATDGTGVLLLLHVINDFGNRFDYLYGITYSRAVTSLIPRRIYPQKPKGFTTVLAEKYLPNEETSLGATAIGEMYANFGVMTLVLFPLFTLGVMAVSQWAVGREDKHGLVPSVLFVLLVWASRVTVEESFIEFLLVVFLISVLRLEKGLRCALPARLVSSAVLRGTRPSDSFPLPSAT